MQKMKELCLHLAGLLLDEQGCRKHSPLLSLTLSCGLQHFLSCQGLFLKQIKLSEKQEAGMCLTKDEQSLLLLILLL